MRVTSQECSINLKVTDKSLFFSTWQILHNRALVYTRNVNHDDLYLKAMLEFAVFDLNGRKSNLGGCRGNDFNEERGSFLS